MYLERKDESDLTANEKLVLSMIKEQSIEYFPIGKAMTLQQQAASDSAAQEEEAISSKVGVC
jgi:hypothetical protein